MNYQSKSFDSQHGSTEQNSHLCDNTLYEIKIQLMNKQQLKRRYIKLMKEAQKIFGKEEAQDLIEESELIWKKLSA